MRTTNFIWKFSILSVAPEKTKFKWYLQILGNRSGLPLLWLHGFMGAGEDWEALVAEHFSEYCNILVDLPGHGCSIIFDESSYSSILDNLKEQLTVMGIAAFIPIGYSMGGRIALHLQQRFPQSIPALIGLSMAPGLKTDQERQQRRQADTELMNKLDQHGFTAFLEEWYKMPLFQSIYKNEKLLTTLMSARSSNDPDQLRKSIDLFGNGALPSLWQALQNMDIPILLINGSKDSKYCNINQEMFDLLPQARQQIIQDGDHAFHLEKSMDTALAIRHFLREINKGV